MGYVFQSGDMLAFSGRGWTSRVIKLGTCSRYSHVGGIVFVDRWLVDRLSQELDYLKPFVGKWTDRYLLIESTTLCDTPCFLTGKHIRGVQAHLPNERIEAYDGRVWMYRLWPAWRLTQAESNALATYLLRLIGTPYSELDAIGAGGNILKRFLPRATDWHSAFCSQLWCGALERVARNRMENCIKVNPRQLLTGLVETGVYYEHQQLKPRKPWNTHAPFTATRTLSDRSGHAGDRSIPPGDQ